MAVSDPMFITGGTGLLGLNWAQTTKDRYHVTLSTHKRHAIPPRTKGVNVRLSDPCALYAALYETRPAVVVHTAGLTSVEACEADPECARRINVKLAENVALQCARLKIPMVHVSTDHLFDGEQGCYSESDPVTPLNVYASTKADAEKAVLDRHPLALVVRTNFYCWGPPYRQSISDWIIQSLRRGNHINLFADVIFTPIVASSLVQVVHELVDRSASGVFHVTGDDAVSKYDFGLEIAKTLKLDDALITRGKLAEAEKLVRRPLRMNLSNLKAAKLIGRNLGSLSADVRLLARQGGSPLVAELESL